MFNTTCIGKLHVNLAVYPSLKRLPVDRFLFKLINAHILHVTRQNNLDSVY